MSPYLGQVISSNNHIVTAVGDAFFFIQTPPQRSDDDTSDSLLIYTGSPAKATYTGLGWLPDLANDMYRLQWQEGAKRGVKIVVK